jgi:hypothetical protein
MPRARNPGSYGRGIEALEPRHQPHQSGPTEGKPRPQVMCPLPHRGGRHDHFICRAQSQRQLSIDGTEAPCQTIMTPTRSDAMPSLAPSLVMAIASMVVASGIGL